MTSDEPPAGHERGLQDQLEAAGSARTLGVDFASQPKGTVGCWITWYAGTALVGRPIRNLDDATLKTLIREADRTGIDVPFGWPDEFVAELDRHRSFAPWQTPEAREDEIFLRTTDRHVRATTGQLPLSVSADKIGRTAVRAARVLFELRASGVSIDRSGETGKVLEVYPAAALKRWVEGRFRYKNATRGKEELLRLAGTLFERDWLRFQGDCRATYETSSDCLDALIASLVVRAHSRGLCEIIPETQMAKAQAEGWIAIPQVGSLDRLVGG